MLAYMDRSPQSNLTTHRPALPVLSTSPATSSSQAQMLLGILLGTGSLVVVLLAGFFLWRCCRAKAAKEKGYRIDHSLSEDSSIKPDSREVLMNSDSMVVLGIQSMDPKAMAGGTMTRSRSEPLQDPKAAGSEATVGPCSSQPLSLAAPLPSPSPRFHPVVPPPEPWFHSQGCLPDQLSSSCATLDECYGGASTRCHSLPHRNKTHNRPLSTVDDINELYAKVNFSKKRKNRMRNDSAAAIALTKSQSTFINIPTFHHHKDTDSLVDNEAVVVYDERTAL